MPRLRLLVARVLFWPPTAFVYYLGFLIHLAGGWMRDLAKVLRRHVYYPMVVAKRVVAGHPTWKPQDLQIGVMPETKRQLAIARADKTLVEVPACMCGNPECAHADKKMFVPRGALDGIAILKSSELSIRNGQVHVTTVNRPPDPPAPAA